jgi:hypothetical protein
MALLIHPEDLLLRCRTIAQISTANPATKMAATHHGPTPVGMGRRMMITQIHQDHLFLFCGSLVSSVTGHLQIRHDWNSQEPEPPGATAIGSPPEFMIASEPFGRPGTGVLRLLRIVLC